MIDDYIEKKLKWETIMATINDFNDNTAETKLTDININEDEEFKHYKRYYKGIKLDPYRILDVYDNVKAAPHQHVVKKLLRAGESIKDLRTDVEECIKSLNRWLEMMDEGESD